MKWLTAILTYLPVVLKAIVAVEGTLKETKGETKKQVVLSIVNAAAEAGTTAPDGSTSQEVSKLVDVTVDALNGAGVFSHKGKER